MMMVIAGVLALVLVAGCGWLIGLGGVGDLLARSTPMVKVAVFGIVLVLVAAAGWTIGSIVGPIGDRPTSVIPASDDDGHNEHGD
jgi:drug/metabolite transporter (DMT)-like permease